MYIDCLVRLLSERQSYNALIQVKNVKAQKKSG